MKEKRLVEERVPQTKPVYKIGGPGSVGLQSIYGIQNLVETKRAGYWIGLIQTISSWNQEMNYSGHRWKDG